MIHCRNSVHFQLRLSCNYGVSLRKKSKKSKTSPLALLIRTSPSGVSYGNFSVDSSIHYLALWDLIPFIHGLCSVKKSRICCAYFWSSFFVTDLSSLECPTHSSYLILLKFFSPPQILISLCCLKSPLCVFV